MQNSTRKVLAGTRLSYSVFLVEYYTGRPAEGMDLLAKGLKSKQIRTRRKQDLEKLGRMSPSLRAEQGPERCNDLLRVPSELSLLPGVAAGDTFIAYSVLALLHPSSRSSHLFLLGSE
jgi:hypothetical protein